MSTGLLLQYVVVGLAVLVSVLTVLRKLAPERAKRAQSRLSAMLDRPGRADVTRRLGRWLQPADAKSGDCGSGDGCSTCGGCAPARRDEPMPLEFRSRR